MSVWQVQAKICRRTSVRGGMGGKVTLALTGQQTYQRYGTGGVVID